MRVVHLKCALGCALCLCVWWWCGYGLCGVVITLVRLWCVKQMCVHGIY